MKMTKFKKKGGGPIDRLQLTKKELTAYKDLLKGAPIFTKNDLIVKKKTIKKVPRDGKGLVKKEVIAKKKTIKKAPRGGRESVGKEEIVKKKIIKKVPRNLKEWAEKEAIAKKKIIRKRLIKKLKKTYKKI